MIGRAIVTVVFLRISKINFLSTGERDIGRAVRARTTARDHDHEHSSAAGREERRRRRRCRDRRRVRTGCQSATRHYVWLLARSRSSARLGFAGRNRHRDRCCARADWNRSDAPGSFFPRARRAVERGRGDRAPTSVFPLRFLVLLAFIRRIRDLAGETRKRTVIETRATSKELGDRPIE